MAGRESRESTVDTEPPTMRVAVPEELPSTDRRRLLAAIGGAGVTVVAGCLDTDDTDEDVEIYELVFVDHDQTVEVRADEDILDPALDAGVDIPYSCLVGRCGQCTARYDGDANDVVTHDGNEYLEDEQIEDGWILTCVAYPEADFELEVAHPDD